MSRIAPLLRYVPEWLRVRPGDETVIARLCDVVVIQAIRAWMASADEAGVGWLGALCDERVGRSLALVHRDPEKRYSVATLAQIAGMSRSAYAARFAEYVGEPPMRYVTRWRMNVAFTWLREGRSSVSEVAFRLGYGSEAAFSHAFKRLIGVSPGAARRMSSEASHASTAPT